MNFLRTWHFFHRSERHYHQLSYRLMDAAEVLNRLDARRRQLQGEVAELGRNLTVCATCGECCRGAYDHHTSVDYLLRLCSDRPLKTYGRIWKPKSFFTLVVDNVVSLFRKAEINRKGGELTGCPDLGPTGCLMAVEDRPVRCLLWTCRAFRDALSEEERGKMGRLMVELDGVSRELVQVFRRGL
jgi:hypothetical protein